MKKSLNIIIISLAALLFASCGMEVDWCPVIVSFCVQDSDGNDLLDPANESFIGDQIILSYNGSEYMYSIPTKTYLPVFFGFTIDKDSQSDKYCARFGELNGEYDYDDDFLITFPDGSSKTIHYDRKVSHLTISARQKWSLDGEKVDYPVIITY